jgi:DNA repair exonuclease SbcCD ATPase subunit
MIVTLKNVRMHEDRTIRFDSNAICLIKGDNGSGKSSIFEAMAWCLYKHKTEIYDNKKAKTIVSIQFLTRDMTVTRQRNPGLLTVIMANSQLYEDAEAQKIIEQTFGQHDSWLCSSYMKQGNRCLLLSTSSAGKMDILNLLSFNTDNPATYKAKIDEKISTLTNHIQGVQIKFNIDCQNFQSKINSTPVDMQMYVPISERQKYMNENSEYVVQIESLKKKLVEYHQLKGMKETYLRNSNNIMNELSRIPNISIDEIEINEKQINEYGLILQNLTNIAMQIQQYQTTHSQMKNGLMQYQNNAHQQKMLHANLLQKQTHIQTQIASLQQQIDGLIHQLTAKGLYPAARKYTDLDMHQTQAKINEYQSMINLCRQCNCNYDIESINREIQSAENILNQQPKIDILKQIEAARLAYFSSNDRQYMSITSDDIVKKKQLINEISAALQILKCPHCNNGLRIAGNRIVPDVTPTYTSDDLQRANNEANELQMNYQKGCQITNQRKQLETLVRIYLSNNAITTTATTVSNNESLEAIFSNNEHPLVQAIELNKTMKPLSPNEVNMLKNRIFQCKSIKVLPQPVDNIAEIKMSIQCDKYQNDMQILLTQARDIENNITNCNKTLQEIENNIHQWNTKIAEFCESHKAIAEMMTNNVNSSNQSNQSSHQNQSIDNRSSQKQQLTMQIQELQRKNAMIRDTASRKKVLEQQYEKIMTDLGSIVLDETISEQLSHAQSKVDYNTYIINNSMKIDELNNCKYTLDKDKHSLDDMQKKLAAYYTIKKIAVETEYAIIENVIESINVAIESIAQYIFNEPISIIFKSHKLVATTKQSKPEINLSIIHRGKEYNNISKLSHGYADRVSLAVMLALSKINSCPFIIFDETLAHVTPDLKEACVKTIRYELSHKTVMIVQHQGTEGYYDQVIHIGHQ